MNEMDQILMREHHLRTKPFLEGKGFILYHAASGTDLEFHSPQFGRTEPGWIEAVGNAVRELEKAGYVERHREYSPEGHISGVRYILHRTPCQGKPAPEKHQPEK